MEFERLGLTAFDSQKETEIAINVESINIYCNYLINTSMDENGALSNDSPFFKPEVVLKSTGIDEDDWKDMMVEKNLLDFETKWLTSANCDLVSVLGILSS